MRVVDPDYITCHTNMLKALFEDAWLYLENNHTLNNDSALANRSSKRIKLPKDVILHMEKLKRFKGKVIWLENNEIHNPKTFYERVFHVKKFREWIVTIDDWMEYSLSELSICEIIEPSEVFRNYILLQKLAEMANLIEEYGIYGPPDIPFVD